MNRLLLALALSVSGLVSAEAINPTAVEVLLSSGHKNHSYRIEMLPVGDAFGITNVGMRKTGDGYETVLGPTKNREPLHSTKGIVLAEGKGSLLSSLGAKLDPKELMKLAYATVQDQLHAFREPRLSGVEIRVVVVKSVGTAFYSEVSAAQVVARYSADTNEWSSVKGPDTQAPSFTVRFVE